MEKESDYKIEILTRLTKIETILESFKKAEERTQECIKETEDRSVEALNLSKENQKAIEEIKDNNKWLFRTTVGAVITGLIAIVLSFFK